jgi:hypothetical protein
MLEFAHLALWRHNLLDHDVFSSGFCQVFIFEVRGVNQFEHGIAEKIWVFAVVEEEAHFI